VPDFHLDGDKTSALVTSLALVSTAQKWASGGGSCPSDGHTLRSGPRTVVKSTSVFACFEPLGGPCFCLMKQNSFAKNRSTPLDRLSKAIPCEVLAYLCLREQESFLTPHIAPVSRAVDASPSLSLSGRVECIRLMLCLSFYEWRCIYSGEQMQSSFSYIHRHLFTVADST